MSTIIRISSKEKDTSIRIKEQTKKMLETLSQGKETHEDIVRRLIKQAQQLSLEQGTKIIEKGRISGTQYERVHKELTVYYDLAKYSVVCTYNDLSIINVIRKNNLLRNNLERMPEWELDLKVVNIRKGNGDWKAPSKKETRTEKALYYVCVKSLLEEFFDLNMYELMTEEDLLDVAKWKSAYTRNNLSEESYDHDIMRK